MRACAGEGREVWLGTLRSSRAVDRGLRYDAVCQAPATRRMVGFDIFEGLVGWERPMIKEKTEGVMRWREGKSGPRSVRSRLMCLGQDVQE